MTLAPGDTPPPFALPDQRGHIVELSSFAGRRVLVFFYPKADTPGCTTQACGLRDVVDQLGDTAVVGVSPDAPERQARFDAKHGIGYPLLSDPDHQVAEAWGCWGEKSLYGRRYMGIIRSAFLLDAEGRVERAWYKVSPKATVTNLLKAVTGPS